MNKVHCAILGVLPAADAKDRQSFPFRFFSPSLPPLPFETARAVCPDIAISRKSGAFCSSFAPYFLQFSLSAKTKKVALFNFLKF